MNGSAHIGLRKQTSDDRPLLIQMMAERFGSGLDHVDEKLRSQIIEGQVDAQLVDYQRRYPNADWHIVTKGHGPAKRSVGRMVVDRTPPTWTLVDISVLAEHQRAGIGTGLLNLLLTNAQTGGWVVELTVDTSSPAFHWYQRLGFVISREGATRTPFDTGGVEQYVRMHFQ